MRSLKKTDVKADVLTGTPNINLKEKAVHYYTSNASGNWVFNVRADATTGLEAYLQTNESMTFTAVTTQGSTAYYCTGLSVDGNLQTIKWVGGTPTAGTPNALDTYTFSIIKTASNTYTVLGSLTSYE